MEYKVRGVEFPRPVKKGDDISGMICSSCKDIRNGDVIVITSKIVATAQGRTVKFAEVSPTDDAIALGKRAGINPAFAQLIIDEAEEVIGHVRGAVLTKTPYGLLPNSGIDESNTPEGTAVLLPVNPTHEAAHIRERIEHILGVDVAVIISDSNVTALRRGTIAFSIGAAGISETVDKRGQKDIYGKKLRLTSVALADGIATAANLVMGEADEMVPVAVCRGLSYTRSPKDPMMSEDECLIYTPLVRSHGSRS